MTASTGRSRYSTVAMVLHWIIAATLIFQIILGWRAGDGPSGPATFALFQLHKSIGITILALSLARLGWRLANPPPPQISDKRWERIAAEAVHWGFYGIMIGLPLTGWLIVSTSRTGIPTVLFGVLPWPDLPGFSGMAAAKSGWRDIGELGHNLLVKLTYGLFTLHVGAALKHQLLDRDAVLSRMAAGARPGWGEPRLWLIAAGFAVVVAVGYLVMPPTGVAPAATVSPPPTQEGATDAATTPAVEPVVGPTDETAAAIATEATTPAAPDRWTVSPGSTLGFVASWSGSPINGRFKTWGADIAFSPQALDASRVSVTIDLVSADTGDGQRDASLASADWFDAAAHPKATYRAERFTALGGDRYRADGTLTLRGVSKPLALPFTLKIDGDTARVTAQATLDRTAFGVGQGEWASTDSIGATVTVKVDLTATR